MRILYCSFVIVNCTLWMSHQVGSEIRLLHRSFFLHQQCSSLKLHSLLITLNFIVAWPIRQIHFWCSVMNFGIRSTVVNWIISQILAPSWDNWIQNRGIHHWMTWIGALQLPPSITIQLTLSRKPVILVYLPRNSKGRHSRMARRKQNSIWMLTWLFSILHLLFPFPLPMSRDAVEVMKEEEEGGVAPSSSIPMKQMNNGPPLEQLPTDEVIKRSNRKWDAKYQFLWLLLDGWCLTACHLLK